MIDLHLHTTASDGLLSPDALVARVAAAGIRTLSVTDHDTVAGLARAEAAAAQHGLGFLPGIEITAVEHERDVHVLGYGFDPSSVRLAEFLRAQRADRVARARRIAGRLAELGMPIDVEAVLGAAPAEGRAIGRPQVARALVAQGHVGSVSEAFDRWLGRGQPAFMSRTGASAIDVVALIAEAGGLASLAHPGVTQQDMLIPLLASRGLAAIEVWHSDHDAAAVERYRAEAAALGLLATGGSDFHGDVPDRRARRLGEVSLPQEAFDRFVERLREVGAYAARGGSR